LLSNIKEDQKMKSLWISFALVAAFSVAGNFSLSAQSPEQLYQKGLMKEEGEGALKDAIDLYNQVADNTGADQALRAKAMLHVGMCYEKLGTKEAIKAYQRLVQSFPAQKNEVEIARERLNKLLVFTENVPEVIPTPSFRKIEIPTELSWSIRLSPDGKDLIMIADKKLWIMPVTGNLGPGFPGTPKQLNTENIEVEWTGLSWSKDGNWIAFNEWPLLEDTLMEQNICIVSLKGGAPEKVVEAYRDARVNNYKIGLSPDGRSLAYSSVEDNKQHLYTVPVDSKNPVMLTRMEAREPVYSPDGNWIAFAEDRGIGRGAGDLGLWVIPAEGGTPRKVADAGKASSPVWSPDGSMIAFLDDFVENKVFITSVNKSGQATGVPVSVEAPEGINRIHLLAGWTPDNKLGALTVSRGVSGLYTLPAEGGQAAMIMHGNTAYAPRWSRDGKEIVYTALSKEVDQTFTWGYLSAVSSTGGVGKALPAVQNGTPVKLFMYGGGNRISPDGTAIVAGAWRPEDMSEDYYYPSARIWKLAIDGSTSVQLTTEEGPFLDVNPCWSPDGNKIVFNRVRFFPGKKNQKLDDNRIYVINAEGGEPELLISTGNEGTYSLVWSPDGELIAYLSRKEEPDAESYLKVLNMNDRSIRVIGEVSYAGLPSELAWSPDSRKIGFVDIENDLVKVMSLDNGAVEEIHTGLNNVNIYQFDWSPDGKRFVFCGRKTGEKEFWFLEDFLPLNKLPAEYQEHLAHAEEEITIRQVWTGAGTDNCGTISRDGTMLSFVDWETGDLALRDLRTKENIILTREGTWNDPMHFALINEISPEGKRIAYSWYNDKGAYDLKIIDINEKLPKTICTADTLEEIYPVAWFADGKKLIIQKFKKINYSYVWHLSTLNVTDGQTSPIKEFHTPFMTSATLLLNDQFLAYDFPDTESTGRFDINLIPVNGGEEMPLVNHPANDRLLGWLPFEKVLLFSSDRSGTTDIWAQSIQGDMSVGEPKRLVVNIGNAESQGTTNSGSLYYNISQRKFESFIAPFDPETGKIVLETKTPLLGSLGDVCWLDDGKSMICVQLLQNPANRPEYKLGYLNIQTGEMQNLAPQLFIAGMPRLSLDQREVLVFGLDKKRIEEEGYRGGIFSIDLATGELSEIIVAQDVSQSYSVEWDAEGTSIYYTSKDHIIKHEMETGEERILFTDERINRPTLRRSYDGDHLLFDLQVGENEKHLLSIPDAGGEAEVLCKLSTSGTPLMYKKITTSPDGAYIYLTVNAPESGSALWRIPTTGGEPEKIWVSRERLTGITLHPDGNQIALSVLKQNLEIRAVENLPAKIARTFAQTE
jgi:Tol biopolymer transport system component